MVAISALMGLGLTAANATANAFQKKKEEQQLGIDNMYASMGKNNMTAPLYTFATGGVAARPANIEVEGGEVVNPPMGNPTTVQGPSHAQGGVDMTVPADTQVFSDQVINPETGNTFADDAKEIEKNLKKFKGNKSGTKIDLTTSRLMSIQLQEQLDALFAKQQELNGDNMGGTGDTFAYGGGVDPVLDREGMPLVTPINIPQPKFYQAPGLQQPTTQVFPQQPNPGVDGLSLLNAAATLGGTAYNLYQGMSTAHTSPNYNPYEGGALEAMRNRSYNIDPILAQNRASQVVANRNITNAANSAGAMMGNYIGSQNARAAADANAWATKQNADNAYMGEYAQLLNNAGQNRAAMDWQVQLANEQNKAMSAQHIGQATADLSEFAQMQKLMRGEATADKQRLGIYQDLYKSIVPFMKNSGMMQVEDPDFYNKFMVSMNNLFKTGNNG